MAWALGNVTGASDLSFGILSQRGARSRSGRRRAGIESIDQSGGSLKRGGQVSGQAPPFSAFDAFDAAAEATSL